MNKYRVKTNLVLVVLTLLILSLFLTAHAAQNCTNLLQDHINWANKPDIKPLYPNKGESYRVGLTKTTNANNRKFASFTEATLDLTNPTNPTSELVGMGTTWFSDRRELNNQPFTGNADQLKLTLRKHTDPLKMNVKLELLSWGVQENFEAQCDNGHIHAFKTDHHGTHLVDITLSKVKKVTSEVCIDFEPPLVQGTKYGAPAGHVSGNLVFTSKGIPVTIWDFNVTSGGASRFNFAQIATPQITFSSGQSISPNNINLEFDFSKLNFKVSQVQFKFLVQGGFENIAVNGSPIFVGDLPSAPNPIGGVRYTIISDPHVFGSRSGTMILDGAIQKLKIGGQEFWIDQVCASDY